MSIAVGEGPGIHVHRNREAESQYTNQKDQRKFLSEVQGLRALAVLMVVTYHIWFGRNSGGVDVFLLISAFFDGAIHPQA